MTRIALLTTSETDLLSARASGAEYLFGNPTKLTAAETSRLVAEADLIVFRFLGGPEQLPDTFDACRETGVPLVVLGGQQVPEASLMELSSVPVGVAAQAHLYLAQGGTDNLRNLHGFLADTVLLTGDAFEPVVELPAWGALPRDDAPTDQPDGHPRPRIGIIFYRAHFAAGNIGHIIGLADAIDAAGGRAVPIHTASLRDPGEGLIEFLGTCDALITTVLAAGGSRPADASAGGDDSAWDVEQLAGLDIPILQALTLTWSRDNWLASDDGMTPLDVATQIAVPEFDGRIITIPISFKEIDADGLPRYVPDAERCDRMARLAINYARLRYIEPKDRKIAVVLSSYPTKHSRIGNGVGLDTPVSVIRLLNAMADAGYDLGEPGEIPGTGPIEPVEGENPETTAGNALIHALIEAGGQDEEWLTQEQLTGQPVRIPAATYRKWFDEFPADLQDEVREHWGDPPGEVFLDRSNDPEGEIVAATLRAGNIVVLVQPPRGFGENPIAIYHDPDLPPSHHYLAVYRWLELTFGAHAVVHVGKHGNLEWLSGKGQAMDAASGPDATLGNLPLIYPFLVNDPGEGTQAKRRAHATIVDHLIPPMARAESYGDIARLEQLLDEYGNVSVMDPAKAPALQGEIWQLMKAAQMHQDLGLEERPEEDEFDDFVMHVDGWLCEIKDVQIRDGLHILSEVPAEEGLVNLVLAVLRANQIFGGRADGVPGLRVSLGLPEDQQDVSISRDQADEVEAQARELVVALAQADWDPAAVPGIAETVAGIEGASVEGVRAALLFAAEEVVPRLRETADEIPAVLHALDGGYIPAGPSGSPLRGLVNVLPTGRNFYSVDPKAIPSRLAWETGQAVAENLVQRYLAETGEYPTSVGLSMWGTSAMRTSGDDIAEIFALLGIRPVWDEQSRRVTGLEPMSLAELGRPRIDVTVRISGFFRDAFPHAVALLDDAVALAAAQDEPDEMNYVRANVAADLAEHGDERRARTRVFGSKPGTYGAGILQLLESGNWRTDEDLAKVYATWGGYAYGRDLNGVAAQDDMNTNYRRIKVAAKNVDSREHDIIDSDDYFQYHGGMVAMVRALTGDSPKAYVGDTTIPQAVRTRSLAEETARVFRARVVNPRWLAAMRRHGYKGAFEMAASVDYLFGFDATARVVNDWMYESIANTYLLDEENQQFLRQANPWALRNMIEKLQESIDRGLWEEPDQDLIDQLHELYLDVEGELEE